MPGSRASQAAPPSKDIPVAPTDPNDLALEVAALETLQRLQPTPAQLQTLTRLKGLASEPKREVGKISGRLRTALTELRTALIHNDEDKIAEWTIKREELEDKEEASLDDTVEITERSASAAGEFVHILSPRQVIHYLGDREDVPDLPSLLLATLLKGRSLQAEAWKELRDEVAEEMAVQLAGAQETELKKAREAVRGLLEAGRKAKDMDKETLSRETLIGVSRLVGKRGPFDLLHNVIEHDVAELLTNPRMQSAAQALLAAKKH
jgi:hypothetical protein